MELKPGYCRDLLLKAIQNAKGVRGSQILGVWNCGADVVGFPKKETREAQL